MATLPSQRPTRLRLMCENQGRKTHILNILTNGVRIHEDTEYMEVEVIVDYEEFKKQVGQAREVYTVDMIPKVGVVFSDGGALGPREQRGHVANAHVEYVHREDGKGHKEIRVIAPRESWIKALDPPPPKVTPPLEAVLGAVNAGPWLALAQWIDALSEYGDDKDRDLIWGLQWLYENYKFPDTNKMTNAVLYNWTPEHWYVNHRNPPNALPNYVCRHFEADVEAVTGKVIAMPYHKTLVDAYKEAALACWQERVKLVEEGWGLRPKTVPTPNKKVAPSSTLPYPQEGNAPDAQTEDNTNNYGGGW